MKRIALFSIAIAFASPALAAPMTESDRYELYIDSGRIGVMMHEARTVLPTITAPDRPAPPENAGNTRAMIFDNLVGAVHEYNAINYSACHAGVVGGDLCKGPYLPKWLTANGAHFTDTQLAVMDKEAMGRIQPFWSAICEKAPSADDDVCPME